MFFSPFFFYIIFFSFSFSTDRALQFTVYLETNPFIQNDAVSNFKLLIIFVPLCSQEEQDRLAAEKRRQAELARLRREKRQAERESKFDEAALVLGLAERNRQNLEER